MLVIRTIRELIEYRNSINGKVGLVPTMGALHIGHMSLVDQARKDNDYVIVSTFVNPTQFAPNEDFDAYPRTFENDYNLLVEHKADVLFVPTPKEMYPDGFSSWIEVLDVTQKLEGACRPTHFKGVTTVVSKLFNLTRADNAYFGQKDAQQVAVIQKMVDDLNFHVKINVMPIIRESNGLAVSSRNVYLSADERNAALILSRTIKLAEEKWKSGLIDASELKSLLINNIKKEPSADIDYVSINHWSDLTEITDKMIAPILVSMAVRIGKTRLIDNTILR